MQKCTPSILKDQLLSIMNRSVNVDGHHGTTGEERLQISDGIQWISVESDLVLPQVKAQKMCNIIFNYKFFFADMLKYNIVSSLS